MLSKRLVAILALGAAMLLAVPLATVFGSSAPPAPFPRSQLAATALGTGFNYQGRLTESGAPANGTYDFRFIAYDAETGGAQVGTTEAENDVAVTNGLFNVTLDFGAAVFNGDARWLEIAVRKGSETGTYTVLSPRQPIAPAPYALYARAAGSIAVPFLAEGTEDDDPLVTIAQSGEFRALNATREATTVTEPVIMGTNAGSGAGVLGESTFDGGDSVGVLGLANTTGGIGGSFAGTRAGIQVDGSIEVTGDTRAAFVVTADTAANTCDGDKGLIVEGRPDLVEGSILVVSQSGTNVPEALSVMFDPPSGCAAGADSWVIYKGTAWADDDTANVHAIQDDTTS